MSASYHCLASEFLFQSDSCKNELCFVIEIRKLVHVDRRFLDVQKLDAKILSVASYTNGKCDQIWSTLNPEAKTS